MHVPLRCSQLGVLLVDTVCIPPCSEVWGRDIPSGSKSASGAKGYQWPYTSDFEHSRPK